MNLPGWLLWGFVATVILTALLSGSQGLRLTRINLPYIVGTFVTPNRDRALFWGFLRHLLDGWFFSLIYVFAFQSWGEASWWRGAGIGLVHGAFVLTAGMKILPGLHPRMATERHGPTVVRQLEPPGFLALNYGVQTPIAVLIAHVIFGAVLGGFYRLA